MGNCCCPETDDSHPFVEQDDSRDVRSQSQPNRNSQSQRSSRTSLAHRNHGRAHTELFRPTASPLNSSGSQQIEEQQKAQRKGIISQIPTGVFDMSSKKHSECAICMVDFEIGDEMKFLPCMHVYHKDCIDDWLFRSLRCPACMEPVDAALLSSFGVVSP